MNWVRMDSFGMISWQLRGKGFHISYNPDTASNSLGQLMDEVTKTLGQMTGLDMNTSTEETAIVIYADGKEPSMDDRYFILNGDFRKEYEKRMPSLKKCMAFYEHMKLDGKASTYSEGEPEEQWDKLDKSKKG